ncbi:MAG: PaaI family thioesterase [Chloroflexi bacterium]|nr:MAG: PaaI family thioesterase [Chloroflexota bacterium]
MVAPVGELVGFRPTSIETGKAVFELDAGPQHANPMGTLHGGIICDIADAAMGVAYASTLGEGESFTTLELKINFLRPFRTGKLIANAHLVKGGRTIGLVECDVTDTEGRLVARAMSTCMTLRGDASEGR